jgi:hypothetical protein
MLVAGLSVTLLIVGLPLAHLGLRLQGVAVVLVALPLVVLLASAIRPETRWLTHLVFPASHLPLLIARPELTSREVYGGLSGLIGLVAIAVSFVFYLMAVTPRLNRGERPRTAWHSHPDLWRVLAILFAVGPTLALALPALTALEPDPLGAAVALGIGVVVSALAVGLWLPRLTLIEGEQRQEALRHLARLSKSSGTKTTLALVFAAIALTGLAVWSYWRP